MSSLRELQREFFESLRQPTVNEARVDRIVPTRLPARKRLQIYRNHHRASLAGALCACFPVVERLVGKDCFDGLARAYVRSHPPRRGYLHDYGQGFPGFLARAEVLAGLPYVPEVAALEWFRQEAYHAPDAPRLALARLQAVPPRAQETLRLGLHPAVRLMRSSYPVVTIWTTNQRDDEPETVALDGGENALIWRGPDGIHVRRIGEAMQRLLRVLEAGEPFADACETALSAEPAFDPGRALAWICENGVLSTASWT